MTQGEFIYADGKIRHIPSGAIVSVGYRWLEYADDNGAAIVDKEVLVDGTDLINAASLRWRGGQPMSDADRQRILDLMLAAWRSVGGQAQVV